MEKKIKNKKEFLAAMARRKAIREKQEKKILDLKKKEVEFMKQK